jgi:hypothetical protein
MTESRAVSINMYRKTDLTFSEPLKNEDSLFQLELNPDDRLVFNYRAPTREQLVRFQNHTKLCLVCLFFSSMTIAGF